MSWRSCSSIKKLRDFFGRFLGYFWVFLGTPGYPKAPQGPQGLCKASETCSNCPKIAARRCRIAKMPTENDQELRLYKEGP